MKRFGVPLAVIVTVALVLVSALPQPTAAKPEGEGPLYEVKATHGRLVRETIGETTSYVQGVPAEPVHSFLWDGEGVEDIEGEVTVEIYPEANEGEIEAEWTDRNGEWTLTQTMFTPPGHSSGMRLTSATQTLLVFGDPVTTNVYLHGDTSAGGPVLPSIFNYMATWGPAKVTLNGEPFENPFDGPAPAWVTHTMLTAGVRNADGTVRSADGEFYDPTRQSEPGAIDYDDLEFHVVFHDAPGPEMTQNFPPPLSFFYHVQFESVRFEVTAAD